jgi:hypothetical protein
MKERRPATTTQLAEFAWNMGEIAGILLAFQILPVD